MKKIFILLCCMSFISAQAQIEYAINGTPSVNTEYPINANYGYGRSAYIIEPSEINKGGEIIKIGWLFDTGASDSIPVKIYMIDLTWTFWPSNGTWGLFTSIVGLDTVFDGKVKPGAGSICYAELDTPFNHDSTMSLVVLVEANYGGNGLSTHPTQANMTITPSSNKHSVWYANSSPPSGNGTFIGYMPTTWLVFLKETGNPVGSISGRPLCNNDSLYWTNNANNDSVIIAYNRTGVKPYLVNGTTYLGSQPYGTSGDTIIFKGKASNFVHNNVQPQVQHHYYIWHFNSSHKYSASKKTTYWSARDDLYTWNFDGGSSLPSGWSTQNFTVEPTHGYIDQSVSLLLNSSTVVGWLKSINVCGVTPNTHLSFKYRIVSATSYPNTAIPAADIGMISVTISTNNSGSTTILQQITTSNHIAGTAYQTIDIPIGAYALGKPVVIQISCLKGNATNYYMDFDDISLYDVVGMDEQGLQDELLLYPNPAGSVLTIEIPGGISSGTEYFISDINGRKLMSGKISEIKTSLNIESFPDGIYMLTLGSQDKTMVRRWIKM